MKNPLKKKLSLKFKEETDKIIKSTLSKPANQIVELIKNSIKK
jgi:hypothetical protein